MKNGRMEASCARGVFAPGLRFWPWVALLAVMAVYGVTLSRGVYPGPSAEAVAQALGLGGGPLPAHPLWGLLTRGLGTLAGRQAVWALNLFNAGCAAAAAALFGLLVERWLFRAMRPGRDGSLQLLRPEDDAGQAGDVQRVPATVSPQTNDVAVSPSIIVVARVGGWFATAALAFSMPFWSASTRLHAHAFDALLLVAALWALLQHRLAPSLRRALVAAFLCGLGCVESQVFVVASPFVYFALLSNCFNRQVKWERQMALSVAASICGAAVGLLVLNGFSAPGATLLGLLRHHAGQLAAVWPATGWIWPLVLVALPLLVAMVAGSRSLVQQSIPAQVLHLFLSAVSATCLLGWPFSPWRQAEAADRLPVMASLAVAAVAGYLVCYWCRWGFIGEPHESETEKPLDGFHQGGVRWAGRLLGCGLAAVIICAAFLNAGKADGRRGAFADAFAGDVLDRLGGGDWVFSNGMLDHHLQILARTRGSALRLVSTAQTYGEDAEQTRRLRAHIDADPLLAADRGRLHTAVALGPLSLAHELLQTKGFPANRLVAVAIPEVWPRSGHRAVPDGFCFRGARSLDRDLLNQAVKSNRVFWEQAAALLGTSARPLPEGPARFRAVMRREAGRSATLLGALLEDGGQQDGAFAAYAAARRIDPQNFSALLNQYALAVAKGSAWERERPLLERELRARLQSERELPPVPVIVRSYGEIRQPAILSQYGRAWGGAGYPELARSELQRAKELAPAHVGVNRQIAYFSLRQNDIAAGAEAYQAVLATAPGDFLAMAGMASVALTGGRIDEAQQWLDRARQAGATDAVLSVPQAAVLNARGRGDEAITLLRAATEAAPTHFEAWALLAELLLSRNEGFEVEKRILPAMVRIAGKNDHVLIHLVRAALSRAKRPADLPAARTSLIRALKLQPDLLAVWDDLLSLTFALGDLSLREYDASAALRVSPDHPFANFLLGTVLLERGDVQRAEALLRKSLALRPTAPAQNDLAEALRRQGRLPEAEQAVRASLALDDRSYAAWDTLAGVLTDAGRPDEAAQAAARALALCDTDPRIHLTCARAFLAQGRAEEALRVLARPVLLPESKLPPDLRAEVARLRAQGQEARRQSQK